MLLEQNRFVKIKWIEMVWLWGIKQGCSRVQANRFLGYILALGECFLFQFVSNLAYPFSAP